MLLRRGQYKVMPDLRRSSFKKSEETTTESMKNLIAREMSKEVQDRQTSSNVVAKLMGLETATPRNRSRSTSRSSLTYVDNNEGGKFHKHHRDDEIWDKKADLLRKGKCDGSLSDKQMDLVRRKLMEAKHLVTDDKHHRSNEFQEALQVLCSNKDLSVKFLQESNSLFSQHLSDFQPVLPHPETKRITVLRPSKAVAAQKCLVQVSKKSASLNQETGCIDVAQPTQIVVLKPSPGKALDIKAISSSSPYFDEAGDAETREVAKEITRQIRETFRGHCRNETLLSSSSVLSNGYIGDDCSLNRSNHEYTVGNISNSEITSPSSRHSWDCVNKFESPFSSSSLSRVSFSPESSVYREAKKRLSERWKKMSPNGDTQQQKNFPKISTALGDMLALAETKVPTGSNEENNKAKQETRRSISCIGNSLDPAESTSDSFNTFERSNSVPELRLNGGTSKMQAQRERTESRSLKSSWKVSSLFFRNKKSNKERTDAPPQLAMHRVALQQQRSFISEGEVANENQDQPSPVSVLQQDFEEACSGSAKSCTTQGKEISLKSNLIDKSPPIGSIARVQSWEDESYTDTTKPSIGIEEDEDCYGFIKTLLTASGFSDSNSLMTWWHSPDSPLDPSLRDKFANKDLIKRRKEQSNHKLVFDCVNDIITQTTSTLARTGLTKGFDMVEHVWTELKDWTVMDEVVGKMWSYSQQVELNNLGIEIEMMLLQEIVEETVFDFTR